MHSGQHMGHFLCSVACLQLGRGVDDNDEKSTQHKHATCSSPLEATTLPHQPMRLCTHPPTLLHHPLTDDDEFGDALEFEEDDEFEDEEDEGEEDHEDEVEVELTNGEQSR